MSHGTALGSESARRKMTRLRRASRRDRQTPSGSGAAFALLGTLALTIYGCGNSPSLGTASENTTGGTGSTGLSGAGGSSDPGSSSSFSFFVTSQARLFALAQTFNGSSKGFGGDLRYGETGVGAGLRGADDICTAIAEASAPGDGKTLHAFLSATNDGQS